MELAEITGIWAAALEDAGFDPADAKLYAFEGTRAPNQVGGVSWPRGMTITAPAEVEALANQLDDANSPQARGLWRVGVWLEGPVEAVAGVLRHELEHGRQFAAWGRPLYAKHDSARDVIEEHADRLPGNAWLYKQIPMEADADAAASTFLRSLYGDEQIDALIVSDDSIDQGLFRRATVQPIETLMTRMSYFVGVSGPQLAWEFASQSE
jgi:hypothetical protein